MGSVGRAPLLALLQSTLQGLPAVDAAWEGGSAAFGTHDELSDIDAVAVVADEAIAPTFAAVEAALNTLSPVALRYDVPATPGFSQKFYRLQGAGEFLVIDLVFMRRSDPLLFREVELHGRGTTWFDRKGILVETHLDATQDMAQAQARIAPLAAAFAMFQHIVSKERLRGRAVEALVFYQAMTLRPLVEALRLLHCPQRRIFGLRYLARDLPAKVCGIIEALAFVKDLDDLQTKHAQAQALFALSLARLQTLGPGAGLDDLLDQAKPARHVGDQSD